MSGRINMSSLSPELREAISNSGLSEQEVINLISSKTSNFQKFKLTADSGYIMGINETTHPNAEDRNIDNMNVGFYDVMNAYGTLPGNLVEGSNNFFVLHIKRSSTWFRQIVIDIRSNSMWERYMHNGVWQKWYEIVTIDMSGNRRDEYITDADLNNIKKSGHYMGQRLANAPEGRTHWFFVNVKIVNDVYQIQEACTYTGDKWTRYLNNGTWTDWRYL